MGALTTALGLLLLTFATARSDESPKGPKVTHKVRKYHSIIILIEEAPFDLIINNGIL